MKTKVISFLLSLIAVIAMQFGSYLGVIFIGLNHILAYRYVPEYAASFVLPIISGSIGGYLAGFIVFKIYKNVDWKVASVIPSVLAIPAVYIHIWGYFNDVSPLSFISTFGLILGVVAAPSVYIYYLKERVYQKQRID